ncbi:hypothetical protein Goari_017069 [Gossypium aridum]|uniref:Uncharacterized protein n=1 Tax=Gossypium aridum TaxID=34290 RepID=A0A7J8WKY9_GOSAI|nr:hypothetical protein [Gossypium aridum]
MEEPSVARHPMLKGSNYAYCKARMKAFIKFSAEKMQCLLPTPLRLKILIIPFALLTQIFNKAFKKQSRRSKKFEPTKTIPKNKTKGAVIKEEISPTILNLMSNNVAFTTIVTAGSDVYIDGESNGILEKNFCECSKKNTCIDPI